jgi:nucleotide-binding universal stress UspA family protein
MQIRKILVPVDFSSHSRRALDEAILFGKTFAAELHLLHCYRFLPDALALYGVEKPQSFEHDMRDAAGKRMEEWCEIARAHGLTVHSHMVANLPSKETIELAERIGAGLIAIGTRGLTGLKHVVLGSVAERVVRLAPCPVLTVTGRDGAPAAGGAPRVIARILVPVDFSEHAQRALDEAIELAQKFGAELHLLHCYQIHPALVSPYGIAVPETFENEIRTAAVQRLSEWRAKAAARGISVREHLSAHSPSEENAAMAEQLGIDLIVMGTRGLTGFQQVLLGSVAERTIRYAPCPVLTVKSSAGALA